MAAPESEPVAQPMEAEADRAYDGLAAIDSMQSAAPAKPAPRMEKRLSAGRARGGGDTKAMMMVLPESKRSTASVDEEPLADGPGGGGIAPAGAPTRAWFPETFLFEPSVMTDDHGRAELAVRVPDRLTTWRVLALAHDRAGGRGGAVTTFDSTLPTYIDPVLPDALIAGDTVELPVLVVNTTSERQAGTLTVEASGSAELRVSRKVVLEPQRNALEYVRVVAERPGVIDLTFSLRGSDRLRKSIRVVAPGQPKEKLKTGALAADLAFQLPLEADARPESVEVGLTVFPGALALVRNELLTAADRGGLADTVYALNLAGRAPDLLERLGGESDPAFLRRIRLQAGQRILRSARVPQPEVALMIAHGAGVHQDDVLLSRLADRLADTIAGLQRPDGTFTGGSGWTLQRVVVGTAAGIHSLAAVADDDDSRRLLRGARIRAEGAFERYVDAVQDPYTAAAVLAAGGVDGTLAERLRKRVREGLTGTETVRLKPAPGVVTVNGVPPTVEEATALAVLALIDDPEATDRLPGLGNALLAAYRPGVGWGDGRTNLVALDAVTALFADPLPERVTVTLFNGNEQVAQTVLSGPERMERHEIQARTPQATVRPKWRLTAEPAVPGLAYALRIDYRVPWKKAPEAGLTLQAQVAKRAQVGTPVTVTLLADGPGGAPLRVRYALPAGVQPIRADLDGLVRAQKLRSWRGDAGGLTLELPNRVPGTAAQLVFRVVPGLAGQLQAEASQVALANRPDSEIDVAPRTWSISRRAGAR